MATTKKTKTKTKTTRKRAPRLPFLAPLAADEKASADRWARDDEEHLRERSENREFRRKVRAVALTFVENLPALADAYVRLSTPTLAPVDNVARDDIARADIRKLNTELRARVDGLSNACMLNTHDIATLRKSWGNMCAELADLKSKIVELSDDDVAAIRSLSLPDNVVAFPAVVPGGSPLAGPWAQLTLAVGDINANGKVDVSVTGEMAGRTFPRLVVDLDLSQAFSLFAGVKDAIGRAIENVTKGGR